MFFKKNKNRNNKYIEGLIKHTEALRQLNEIMLENINSIAKYDLLTTDLKAVTVDDMIRLALSKDLPFITLEEINYLATREYKHLIFLMNKYQDNYKSCITVTLESYKDFMELYGKRIETDPDAGKAILKFEEINAERKKEFERRKKEREELKALL
ncbi:MAG: hypothetical protein K6E98_06950 [Lachnospiraceae bacterium]|nr:hypothetical protein [Lachnospiraceae bacterium]